MKSTASSRANEGPVLDDETEIAIDNVLWDYRDYCDDTHEGTDATLNASRAALRQRIVDLVEEARLSELERAKAEIKAMDEMYTEVCAPLQDCCQKYHLGLGGEFVQELVVAEVDRLREASLTPEEAHHLLVYEYAPSTIAKLRLLATGQRGVV
jgi:hypothetical protein